MIRSRPMTRMRKPDWTCDVKPVRLGVPGTPDYQDLGVLDSIPGRDVLNGVSVPSSLDFTGALKKET
jgi:hypothetical protein